MLRGSVDVIPVVLVAGVPRVLVPAGLESRLTSTVVTSGAVDPAWWPGVGTLTQTLHDGPVDTHTFNPLRGWLDTGVQWQTFEQARPLEGDVNVEALTFSIHDPPQPDAGPVPSADELCAATAELSAPLARVTQLLSASVTSTSSTILVDSLTDVPSYGIGHIGREAFTYSSRTHSPEGVVVSAVNGDVRGAYGSRAVDHGAPAAHRAVVTFGLPRWWQGRRCAVFLARVSGTSIVDPTPIFLGTIGAGVGLVKGGAVWNMPVDAVTVALNRKIGTASVLVQGFGHRAYFAGSTPLAVDGFALRAEDNDGWHADLPGFVRDLNAGLVASTSLARVFLSGGRINVTTGGAAAEVLAAWNSPIAQTLPASSTPFALQSAAPRACVTLDGVVRLDPLDVAKIPSTLTVTATVGAATGTARFTLVCDTDETPGLVSVIVGRDETASTVTLAAIVDDAPGATGYDALMARARAALVTKPTTAALSVEATGDTCVAALRALVAACDLLGGGGDMMDDCIAWDEIAEQFARVPLPFGLDARRYRPKPDETPLVLLVHEFRLRGCMMVMRYGRVSCARLAQFASTEQASRAIVEGDNVTEDRHEIPAEITYGVVPTASSMTFALPGGASFAWVDETFRDEFGDGAEVTCKALQHMPETVAVNGIVAGLQTIAQQLLGPLAEPSQEVHMTVGPSFFDVMPGDLVRFTHSRVPTFAGVRGVTDLVSQVFDVRRQVFGGVARIVVGIRVGRDDLRGYAPSFLVAAGGITGAIVDADTASAFGSTCFADSRVTAVDGFAVGDAVELCEIDNETPIANASFTVTAVDTANARVTLDAAPGAAWVALAAAQYRVCLRFAPYTTATARQHTVAAYVADPSTGTLGGADAPNRWAA